MRPTSLIPPLAFYTSVILAQSDCKCIYGEECWPSPVEFQALEVNLSTALVYPVPPESACYSNLNLTGPSCADFHEHASSTTWRADQAGSMQHPNLEQQVFSNGTIDACYFNTTLGIPCLQGAVPVVGVEARTILDVKLAVCFASQYNLRLAVKNTGHDIMGRSTARGAFMIWTHYLKEVSFSDTDSKSCRSSALQTIVYLLEFQKR